MTNKAIFVKKGSSSETQGVGGGDMSRWKNFISSRRFPRPATGDRKQRGLGHNKGSLGIMGVLIFFFQDGGSYEVKTRFDEFYRMDENIERNGSTSERGKWELNCCHWRRLLSKFLKIYRRSVPGPSGHDVIYKLLLKYPTVSSNDADCLATQSFLGKSYYPPLHDLMVANPLKKDCVCHACDSRSKFISWVESHASVHASFYVHVVPIPRRGTQTAIENFFGV